MGTEPSRDFDEGHTSWLRTLTLAMLISFIFAWLALLTFLGEVP